MSIVTLGIDLAKNFFAMHGVNAAGQVELQRPTVAAPANRPIPARWCRDATLATGNLAAAPPAALLAGTIPKRYLLLNAEPGAHGPGSSNKGFRSWQARSNLSRWAARLVTSHPAREEKRRRQTRHGRPQTIARQQPTGSARY